MRNACSSLPLENDGTDLSSIWAEQIGECMKELPLWEEEKDILQNIPEYLGILDEKQQSCHQQQDSCKFEHNFLSLS